MRKGFSEWLTNTDLRTARQKYQKAFAAEFLCPIKSLIGFLEEDFSESAIEDAANYFEVSEWTVSSLLANNHFISHHLMNDIPYPMGC